MDFVIRDLDAYDDLVACVDLEETVWGRGFSERVPAALLRVALRVGGVLAGAFDTAGRLLGLVFGITGVRNGRVIHWSDMLAVHPDARDRGIGFALKCHQRHTLLARGVVAAEWSFDPLEARNAHLNFNRLGGTAGEYIRDFYGASDSPLHAGLATDRLIVTWDLDSERVRQRLTGLDLPPRPEALVDVPVLNPANGAGDEASYVPDAPRLLIRIPPSLQELKARDIALAAEWRVTTRAALETCLARGYIVTDAVRMPEGPCLILTYAS